ncbi:MAG: triphosphoribosyl-dephospho-CoA synthase, partial [Rhodospirillales bacterium]|nr:triphosphoribosyl-dephospho-CoA synthase [Rhodospirillales bacterium]
MDTSTAATLACLWEATAAKPGNVYRGADFEDVTYADFITSAAVLGETIAGVKDVGVGGAVLESVQAINYFVGTNTYLGTILLLAPLAACPRDYSLGEGLHKVLNSLTDDDIRFVYTAIGLAKPGGLGKVDLADVHNATPEISLVEAMRLAADRDLVARQYTNGFAEVFATAKRIENLTGPLSGRIVRSFLELLAEIPDTLIAR